MARYELEELRKRKRDQTVKLMEASDLTKQLGEAVDHRDQVSIQMLLSMREDPIRQMQEIEEGIQDYLLTLLPEDAIRCSEMLRGAKAEAADEAPLCDAVARFRRLLSSVTEADRQLSVRLGGTQSFYNKYRE